MNKEYAPQIKCSAIHKEFKKISLDKLWHNHLAWVKTTREFWKQAISKYSAATNLDNKKTDLYVKAADHSFEWMDDWKNGRVKYVQARRKEIDSAISFIRNTALNNSVANLLVSPACRNLAAVLRVTLSISTNGYADEQLPLLYAKGVYDLAAVRTYFPIDTSNLIAFLPPGKGLDGSSEDYSEDNWHLMMEIAAEKTGIGEQVNNLNKEAATIWNNYTTPQDLVIPAEIWERETDGISKELYNQNLRSFHS